MEFFKLVAVLLVVLGSAAAAQAAPLAAQYKLELFLGEPDDPFGDDVADAVGTINVGKFDQTFPEFGLDLSGSIELDGITYDYFGPDGFPLVLNRTSLRLLDALLSGPYPVEPDSVLGLFFGGSQQTPFYWTQRDCSTNGIGGYECVQTGRVQGGYTLTALPAPIPLPASVLLLPVALGALAALRRRRRG